MKFQNNNNCVVASVTLIFYKLIYIGYVCNKDIKLVFCVLSEEDIKLLKFQTPFE